MQFGGKGRARAAVIVRARTRYAIALLAYAFAAIMVGTTLPTPMYALYAERMHFRC